MKNSKIPTAATTSPMGMKKITTLDQRLFLKYALPPAKMETAPAASNMIDRIFNRFSLPDQY
jgi:hypothetical protein